MKIPLQDKIAELEARIVALEKGATNYYSDTVKGASAHTTVTRTVTTGAHFGEHWSKMWDEFHLMMKDVFKP